ncbi:hypothetical protein [Thiocystis violacea]|uniref:hypothetical protein n=1 Tax=Thiocystis violacea TaxID=13725 RepID=UPI001908C2B2|nr:hypothetical protein [Thiocystis violacea]
MAYLIALKQDDAAPLRFQARHRRVRSESRPETPTLAADGFDLDVAAPPNLHWIVAARTRKAAALYRQDHRAVVVRSAVTRFRTARVWLWIGPGGRLVPAP